MELTRKLFILSLFALGLPLMAQTTVFNCGGSGTAWSSSGTCSLSSGFNAVGEPTLQGSIINLQPASTNHQVGSIWYKTLSNDQAFTATFTFQPDGQNIAFVVQNTNNNPGYDEASFSGGAGCEGGFYQGFSTNAPPNQTFGIMYDSYGGNNAGSGTFTYSSVQWYQSAQSPCNPSLGGVGTWGTNKVSTSPVPLNSPSSTLNTCLQTVGGTCDTYSATIIYDGSNLTSNLYDVTAGGTCTPVTSGSCSHVTWTNVFIPSIVGGSTAYIGMASAAGSVVNPYALNLLSFEYQYTTPTGTPTTVAYNANSTTNNGTLSAASPTFNVAPGTYTGTQTVTISSSSSNYICYEVVSSGTPTYYPQPTNDNTNDGGSNTPTPCAEGTLYSGPVSISSTSTLYAAAGFNLEGGPPSPLTGATYTINPVSYPSGTGGNTSSNATVSEVRIPR